MGRSNINNKEKSLNYKKLTPEEYTSDDFILIVLSLLESKGYPGFLEMQALIDNAEVITKILRLMAGMTIKIPSLTEFSNCLKTCVFIYYSLIKESVQTMQDIKQIMNWTDEDIKNYQNEFRTWYKYLLKQGYDLNDFVRISPSSGMKQQLRLVQNELKRETRNLGKSNTRRTNKR